MRVRVCRFAATAIETTRYPDRIDQAAPEGPHRIDPRP
jgi:hypothetical protein